MLCPECGTSQVRRAALHTLKEYLLGLLLVYPFRCQICAHRFVHFLGRPSYNPRRDYHRVLVGFPVVFGPFFSEGPHLTKDGLMVNLSIRGCGIDTDIPLRQGTSVWLKVSPDEKEPPIEVQRAVVRSANGRRVGLEFLQVSSDQEDRLRQIIASRLPG